MTLVAVIIVGVFATYLLGFGALALYLPQRASAFLLGHGQTKVANDIEAILRALVGGAFIVSATSTKAEFVFLAFGSVLVVSACLIAVFHTQHQRFSQWSVPKALPFLPLIGVSSIVFSGAIFWCLVA